MPSVYFQQIWNVKNVSPNGIQITLFHTSKQPLYWLGSPSSLTHGILDVFPRAESGYPEAKGNAVIGLSQSRPSQGS